MIEFSYGTDKGLVRPINEDNVSITRLSCGDIVFMVLDGMGGHLKGEKASNVAKDIVLENLVNKNGFKSLFGCKRFLLRTIKKANKEVNILGSSNMEYYGMGTTLILGYLRKNSLIMCNVGDSRLYSYDNKNLQQLSEDQTYVQFLYKTGKIKKEDMKVHPKRNVLMNALGTYPSLSVACKVFIEAPKNIMICSDGLYNMVEEEDMVNILNLKVV
jgi:protein phosphatase